MRPVLLMVLLLSSCASERHFAADTLWPFGNPNRPANNGSETMDRALGHVASVTPIAPQQGNVWPGPVQPVPTISEEQNGMNQPLGSAYTPSLPSPYPPGQAPPPDADLGDGPLGPPGTQTFVPVGGVTGPAGGDTYSPPGGAVAPAPGVSP